MTTISAAQGDFVAVATNGSPRVLLFNNGNQQSTLIYNKSGASIQKLVFCGNEYLCGLLDDKEGVVVWSISRGVVVEVLKEDVEIQDITSQDDKEVLYMLTLSKGIKLHVQEYAIEPKKLKLVRKIKAGKLDDDSGTTAVAVSRDNNVAVRNGSSVKVFRQEDGEKVFKCKLGTVDGEKFLCLSENYVVTCTSSQIQIFSVEKSGSLVSSVVVSQDPSQIALQGDILVVDKSLYEIASKKKVLTPAATLEEDDRKNCHLAAFAGDTAVHIVVQPPGRPVEVVRLEFLKDGQMLERLALPSDKEVEDKPEAKRSATTLGAGQAGQESLTVTDRPVKRSKPTKGEVEEEDPSIAQRLKQLQQQIKQEDEANDNKSEKKKGKRNKTVATTESVSHLLHQALKSSDHSMLELALKVKDAKVRSTSIDDLTSSEATHFLNLLTSKLSRKPHTAFQYLPWVTDLLASGLITTNEPIEPLQNMIKERTEVFPQLLQLDGRLTFLTTMK